MSKHTPGPWTASKTQGDGWSVYTATAGTVMLGSTLAAAYQDWPRGFWKGEGAVGLSIRRLQFMFTFPRGKNHDTD